MNLINFRSLAAALLLATLLPVQGHADETCLKRVLNRYCLGAEPPAGLVADSSGLIVIDDPRGAIELQIEDNRVAAISRTLTPATWLTYNELKVKLVRLYSTAQDVSDFPAYATSRSSKLNAIRAGRGYAAARWDQPGWTVLLQWASLDNVQLRYQIAKQSKTTGPTNAFEGL